MYTRTFCVQAITAQFQHVNVIALVGVVTVGEPFMIVLDFCAKGSLKQLLSRSDFSPSVQDLFNFCKGICAGQYRCVHQCRCVSMCTWDLT